MRNMRKSNHNQIELVNSNSLLPVTRYQGFSKLYQLNLSKMLLRCHDSPFLHKDDSLAHPQQTLIINTAQMIISAPEKKIIHNNQGHSKLSFRHKNTIHSEKHEFERIFSNPHKLSESKKEKRSPFPKQKRHQINEGNKKDLQDLLKQQISIRLEEQTANRIVYSNGDFLNGQQKDQCRFNQSEKLDSMPEKPAFEQKNVENGDSLSPAKIKYLTKKSSYKEGEIRSERHNFNLRKVVLPHIKQKSEKWMKKGKEADVSGARSPVKKNVAILNRDPEELKHIKSESYAIFQHPTNKLVLSYRGSNPFEIASLTKIMTFYCVRRIQKKFSLNIEEQKVTITDHAMEMGGTSAEILSDEIYTIEQLLYGLMLPSGNDAAVALAIWGGKNLILNDSDVNQEDSANSVECQKKFIQYMNTVSKQLQFSQTRFGNPHGLPHTESRSTAVDVASLTSKCLEDQFFKKVVKTREYKCTIFNKNGTKRPVEWINTNKLLRRPGFIGIKTGITVTAGPCLASAYEFRDKVYIVVVLRCNKVSRRFKETRKLLSWSLGKMFSRDLTGQEGKMLKQLKRNNGDLDSDYSEDERQFNYGKADEAELKKRSNIIAYEM